VDANEQILIFGHKDADGDTLGCSLAMAEALRGMGKQVWVVIPPPLPDLYRWLPGFDEIVEAPPAGSDPRLVLFLDAGNMERSGPAVNHIVSQATIVNVDHHESNSMYGDLNIIDKDAAAVGQMVVGILDRFGVPITPSMATNLYTAILTDTGGFRHENTTAAALEDAARLARLGADPVQAATQVYKSRPLTTLKLTALVMATLTVELDGRLVYAHVTRRMLHQAGAVMAETEGIIDSLNSIAGLQMAIFFKEIRDRLTKISVRSRGDVDSSALCAQFGGGGHTKAAAAEIPRPLSEAIPMVLDAARRMLSAAHAVG
jgi:phosphoesterase RecJ-like protein